MDITVTWLCGQTRSQTTSWNLYFL